MDELFLPDKEYFSIGEVARLTRLPAHTLRYWESEFSILKPVRRASKHRKYTKKDIEKIRKIQEYLYKKKYTIEGAKKALLEENKAKFQQLSFEGFTKNAAAISVLKEIKKECIEILERLKD